MRCQLILRLLLVVFIVALTAGGGAANPTPLEPVEVQVTVQEFTIVSSQITFFTGVPYRFVITNTGKIPHEWMLMPRGITHHDHGMGSLVSVGVDELTPGTEVIREFTFTESGDFEFACHLPGHYEAGMTLPIVVK